MIRKSFSSWIFVLLLIARSIKEIELSYDMFNYMIYRYISLQALKYENVDILHFTFLFSLFVFVSAASHCFRIWTGSIWTGQVPALFQIKSLIQQIVHVTSGHMAVYGPVRHQKYIIWTSEASVHIIFFVTDRSIYCHMTLSAMNYLLYMI